MAWTTVWDRWLAPGDLRAGHRLDQQHQYRLPQAQLAHAESQSISEPQSSPTTSSSPSQATPHVPLTPLEREARMNSLFFGGLAFNIAAAWLTRRALYKRKLLTWPRFYTPSNAPQKKVDGGTEAVDALFLATINVCATFMTAIGAAMLWFDIAEVEDMRNVVRKGVGYDVYGGSREEDAELEGWVKEVLSQGKSTADGDESGEVKVEASGILAKLGQLAEIADREEKRRKERAALKEGASVVPEDEASTLAAAAR